MRGRTGRARTHSAEHPGTRGAPSHPPSPHTHHGRVGPAFMRDRHGPQVPRAREKGAKRDARVALPVGGVVVEPAGGVGWGGTGWRGRWQCARALGYDARLASDTLALQVSPPERNAPSTSRGPHALGGEKRAAARGEQAGGEHLAGRCRGRSWVQGNMQRWDRCSGRFVGRNRVRAVEADEHTAQSTGTACRRCTWSVQEWLRVTGCVPGAVAASCETKM